MDDLISRQAIIDALDLTTWYHQNRNKDMVSGANPSEHQAWYKEQDVYEVLRNMPSAQPERKRGKWIYGEDEYGIDGYRCDKCGFFVLWDYAHTFINYIEDYNFCPNCGADMRGEHDG